MPMSEAGWYDACVPISIRENASPIHPGKLEARVRTVRNGNASDHRPHSRISKLQAFSLENPDFDIDGNMPNVSRSS